ncbi:MAG TPA: DUF6206 family protein [Polyangiaceae bacterium]
MSGPSQEALGELDAKVLHALATGDESGLRVLGYGEISTVVAVTVPEGTFACKRLPPFDSRARFDAYAGVFEAYVSSLRQGGVQAVESELHTLENADGRISAYCVQPILDPKELLPNRLRECTEDEARAIFRRILDAIDGAVNPRLGLDGQLSNWTWRAGALGYLDLTTPLVRDEKGVDALDLDLFLASLPWALRGLVKWLFLKEIIDKYFVPRGIVLDLLGNLYKEQLEKLIPAFLEELGDRVAPALTVKEVRAYYQDDARTWGFLLAARRADRFWQRKVRRRTYPFLLPGPIARHA